MSATSIGSGPQPPPFFIGGCYRSGLTLLRLMLDAHPELSCGPETPALSFSLAFRDLQSTLGELHQRHFNLPTSEVQGNFAHAIAAILNWRREMRGKKRAGEKSAMNVLVFADLARFFPQGQFIHVVRDGRDVAASLLAMKWVNPASGEVLPYCVDPRAAIAYWGHLVQIGMDAEARLPKEMILRVHYEDLARRPGETLADVQEFLGVSQSDKPARFYERNLLQLAGLEKDGAGRFREPVGDASVGRWRRDFDASTQEALTQLAAPQLKALGYL